MSFQDYINNRQKAFNNITSSLKQETNKEQSRGDDRIWKARLGSDGTGYAVVRFLPGKNVDKTPWVRMYDHGFQGPTGKWYIENSLTTIGQQDPVSEHNSRLWATDLEENKDKARSQKRRTKYYTNVLVIKDPNNPENEGQVKIFQFGQKIFDMVMAAMQPEFADEDPVNPFDLIEGANFRIKIKMVGGYWNYDSSSFEKISPLAEDESKLEAIFNAQYDVHELIAPENFKSYDELQTKLNDVLGLSSETPLVSDSAEPIAKPAPIPTAETTQTSEEFGAVFDSPQKEQSSDDDDLESYFKSLAN